MQAVRVPWYKAVKMMYVYRYVYALFAVQGGSHLPPPGTSAGFSAGNQSDVQL